MAMTIKGKKAIFFTIDSILAAGIIISVIIFASFAYSNEPHYFHLNYLSQDIIKTLSTIRVGDIENSYIQGLIDDGTIQNEDNTALEQIAEFWIDGEMELANKTAGNLTGSYIPENFGVGVWINNQTIYTRDFPTGSSLVSSKKIISRLPAETSWTRQNPPTLQDPMIAEVRVWQ